MNFVCKRGEIYFAKLPITSNNIQQGERPVLIIQNNTANIFSNTVICAPITSKIKKPLPTHVEVSLTKYTKKVCTSTILMEQIFTLNKIVLRNRVCILSNEDMDRVDKAISDSLGLI